MNRRIGIDASALTKDRPTGVEVASRELIHALIKTDQENHYFLYSSTPLSSRWLNFENVENKVVRADKYWTQKALPLSISKDNLHVFWSPAYMLPPKLKGIKTIATIHDVAFMSFFNAYSIKDWLLSFFTTMRAKFSATKILAVSEQTKSDLKKYFLIPDGKIEVVYNAVSHIHLRPNLQDIHDKYKLPEQFLLVVGRIELRKNTANILESFKTISQNHPDLHLVFSGPTTHLPAVLEAKVYDWGLKSKVHVIGFVHELDVPMLYRSAEALLFPSLYEGFGLPIIESFAAGTPVITTNYGAPAEIAGKAAMLVNPKDPYNIAMAVSHLLNDEDLKTKYVQAGYERLKNFSWEKSANKLKNIINSLCTPSEIPYRE